MELDVCVISQADVVNTLREFIEKYESKSGMTAVIYVDAAYAFASKLTGLSEDALNEHMCN